MMVVRGGDVGCFVIATDSAGMARGELKYERLTRSVIGAFFKVYNTLGFGFLERIYLAALERELIAIGHRVQREVWIPVFYEGYLIGKQRVDMIVDGILVVEAKSTYYLAADTKRIVYHYLRASNLEVGLLLHFGTRAEVHRCFCSHDTPLPESETPIESSIQSEQSDQSDESDESDESG